MFKVFSDDRYNQELEDKGYVILRLLDKAEIDRVFEFQNARVARHSNSFTTFMVDDYEYRREVDQFIKQIIGPKISGIVVGYESFWGNIFTKPAHSGSMPLHADFQFVDESHSISLNIWCPLQDTNSANGALGIIPYSHKVVNEKRGTNITNHYRYNAAAIKEKFGKTLDIKAGDAIVYDHRLLHYSEANSTDKARLAISLIMTPLDQQLIHYYAEGEDSTKIYQYNINSVEDFFKARFLGPIEHLTPNSILEDYHIKQLTVDDFDMKYVKEISEI